MHTTLKIGDWVKIGKGDTEYEVSAVKKFPHGYMIGIYDEPPTKHEDYWQATSLTRVRKADKVKKSKASA